LNPSPGPPAPEKRKERKTSPRRGPPPCLGADIDQRFDENAPPQRARSFHLRQNRQSRSKRPRKSPRNQPFLVPKGRGAGRNLQSVQSPFFERVPVAENGAGNLVHGQCRIFLPHKTPVMGPFRSHDNPVENCRRFGRRPKPLGRPTTRPAARATKSVSLTCLRQARSPQPRGANEWRTVRPAPRGPRKTGLAKSQHPIPLPAAPFESKTGPCPGRQKDLKCPPNSPHPRASPE